MPDSSPITADPVALNQPAEMIRGVFEPPNDFGLAPISCTAISHNKVIVLSS